MADEASNKPGPFDVQTIKNLVALMSRHDLSEIDLREGEQRIRLRRGNQHLEAAAPKATPASAAAPPAAVPAPAPAAQPPKPAKNFHEIKSPTPGTFYASPKPNADPFVRVGSRVNKDTVVCIIEAMKILNEIPAECSGVIAEILVENQQPVEFGQVLFRVDTSA